ncbi:MAG: PAS domain S-box protein, partial [Candidatus Thermoplasmatota archaeon]|nr:PAS domain S-box protein [Candidatus Thermoplasmatota archaeon]
EYVIMYGIDSTEKHDLFEKLKRTEEKYNILDSNSSDVIWMTDRDMNYTYLSSSIKDLTGYEPEELIGKNIIKRLSRSSYDSLFSRYERDINDFIHRKNRDYRMTTLEMDIKTKNGGETPCDVKINVIQDRHGVPTGLMGITRDISDRKRSWKELSKRENILEAVEQISDKLLRSKPDEGVISVSLEELGKAVGICRVYIFKNSSDENGRNLTSHIFEWTSDSISSQMDNSDLQDLDLEKGGLSRWIRELSSGNVVMGTVRDMSRSEREILEPQGIRSILLTPIFRGDHWWGFMGFDDCNTEREWSNTDIMALKAASNIFGCALNR